MKRKVLKQVFSALLALVMIIGLVPMNTLDVFAAGTSTCDTFAKFKTAMEDPNVDTVKLTSFIEDVSPSGESAITVKTNSGTKKLVLEGSANIWATSKNKGSRYLISVGTGVQLVVSGSGSLATSLTYSDGNNAMFRLNGGEMRFAKDFTGFVTVESKIAGTCGSVVHMTSGNLVSENGDFYNYAECSEDSCSKEHGVIYTDVANQDDAYIALLGGYYHGPTCKKETAVVAGNAQNVFLSNLTYYANAASNSDYVKGYYINSFNKIAWNPYKINDEPNFVIAGLGETGKISFKLKYYSVGNRFCTGHTAQYVALYEKVGNNQWEKIDNRRYDSEKKTFHLDACDTPTVKYYKIVVEYEYQYGGRTTSFTCEREIRAEWKDLSYNGSGTQNDPVKVSTFTELRRAMLDENVEYVEVINNIDYTLNYDAYRHSGTNSPYYRVKEYQVGAETAESIYSYLSSVDITDGAYPAANKIIGRSLRHSALQVEGKKHLILSKNVILKASSYPFDSSDTGFKFGMEANSELTISGGGTFAVTLTCPASSPDAAAIRSAVGATLTIEDAKIIAETGQGTGYAHAIMVSNDGTLIIHDGEFRGQRSTDSNKYGKGFYTGAVWTTDAYVQINGGTFGEVNFGESYTDSIAGFMFAEDYMNRVTVNGGTFETGIIKESGGNGCQLSQQDWSSILGIGVKYTTNTFTKNGVEVTSATVTSPTYIHKVELTTTAPKEGNTPTYVTRGSTDYSVKNTQWLVSDTGQNGTWSMMDNNTKYVAGKYYKVVVNLKATSGCIFNTDMLLEPDVVATVNGYTATVGLVDVQSADEFIQVEYNFGYCNKTMIESVIVENLVAPVVGETPSYTCAFVGTGYVYDGDYGFITKNGITWWDVTGGGKASMWDNSVFVAGHSYMVEIVTRVEDGFNFANAVFATVNGDGNVTTDVSTGGIWCTITYTFTCQPKTIKSVAVTGLDRPANDVHPDFSALTDSEYYTVDRIVWYDYENDMNEMTVEDTFVAGNTYYVIVTVVPTKENGSNKCQFVTGKTKATLNGIEVVKKGGWNDVSSISKEVNIWYTFTATTPSVFVSGTVTSYGSESDVVTLQLIPEGMNEVAYETTVVGNNETYLFTSVEPGNYTLKAIKNKHDTREYKITVDSQSLIQNVELELTPVKGTWMKDNVGWWYKNPDGSYPKACWKEIDQVWYYFNASGYIVTGWQSIGGTWYYFDNSGAMKTGWLKSGSAWYYFNESGAMVTNWQSIGGTWYYFNGSGAMVTGWKAIGGTWYYFNSSGAMMTGWLKSGGTWYYFNGSGAMVTGWQSIGGVWYYFHGSGAMAASQWVGNYYLQADGTMATNKWIGQYYVGADGVWRP